MNRKITLLQSQIDNSGASSSELLERLTQAEKELDELNNEVLIRLQDIESKLDSTTKGTSANTLDIEEMKSSLIRDITAALGTPRFGMMPLPLAKQSIAVSGELLSDANSGHIYFKNGNKVVSKTIELEDELNELLDYNQSAWVAISVNSDNHELFVTSDKVISNSDNTISATDNKIAMDKISIKYDPLTLYTISVRTKLGGVDRAYFKDVSGNEFECVLRNTSGNNYIYRLETTSIGNTTMYPVIETKSTTTTIESILIYKSLSVDLDEYKEGTIFGGSIDSSLIDSSTIVNDDGSFTVNNSHPIHVTIPQESLKTGMYTLVLRVRNNPTNTFTIKTVFNGSLFETKQLNFNNISAVAGGKTGFAEMNVPLITNTNNYIDISTTNTSNIIVDYFLLSLIDFDRTNFYTKGEIDAMDVPTGKTTNTGNAYTLTSTLVSNYYDGLLCKIKINANSTGNVTFRCNSLAYKNVVDANGNQVKTFKSGIWYHLCYNSETGNFTLLGKGGGGNAAVTDVVTGKTFTNDEGEQVGALARTTNIGATDGSNADTIIGGSTYNSAVGRLDLRNLGKTYLDSTMTIHIKNLLPSYIKKDILVGGSNGIKGTLDSFGIGDTINIYDGTNIDKELYYVGPMLTYTLSSGRYVYANTIIPYGDKKFVVMTDYNNTNPKWGTDKFDLQWGSMDDTSIKCTFSNTLGSGNYSFTGLYKVGDMAAANSHRYSSDGDDQNSNKVSIISLNQQSILSTDTLSSSRSVKFNVNNMSADNTYIYGTLLNSGKTVNTAYSFSKSTGKRGTTTKVDVDSSKVMDVVISGTRYIVELCRDHINYYIEGGAWKSADYPTATDIVTFGTDKGIITYSNRYEYVQFSLNSLGFPTFTVLKTYSINASCTVSHYKTGYVIVSASTTSYIHRTSDGALTETVNMNPYTTAVMDGVKYSLNRSSSAIQVVGAPLYIKKLS